MKDQIKQWKTKIDSKIYSLSSLKKVTKTDLISLLEDMSEEMGDLLRKQ